MSTLREAAIGAMGALETARNGLAWYRDRYPESTDGSDDEAAGDIDAAIDALRAELAKPDARPAPAEPQPIAAWSIVRTAESAVVTAVRAALSAAPAPQPAGGMRDFATEVGHWMRRSKEWRKRAEAAEAAEALLSTQPAGGEPQPAAQPEPVAQERYAFVLAQCREAQDIAASRGWALNDIATASTTDPKARKIATEALLGAPQVQRAGLTDEQIDRHSIAAADCPPSSTVILVSSLRRLLNTKGDGHD